MDHFMMKHYITEVCWLSLHLLIVPPFKNKHPLMDDTLIYILSKETNVIFLLDFILQDLIIVDLWFHNVKNWAEYLEEVLICGCKWISLLIDWISVWNINVTSSLGCLWMRNICQDCLEQQSFKELLLAFFTMLHRLSHIKKELSSLSLSPLYQHWSHLSSVLQTWDMLFISNIFNEESPREADGTLAVIN